VLGGQDGIVTTAALMIGVAAASASRSAILIAGFSGLAAGGLSMAAGEYVSVSSQRDAELADLDKERGELAHEPDAELAELTAIYRRRGLSAALARQVAVELTNHDALAVHARDELGIDIEELARPAQAAVVSAGSFAVGGLLPLLVVVLSSSTLRVPGTVIVTLVALMLVGAAGARLGGASPTRAVTRAALLGMAALGVTAIVGSLAHVAVG